MLVLAWGRGRTSDRVTPLGGQSTPFRLKQVGSARQPTAIAVTPSGQLLITEQAGTIIGVDPATGASRPVVTIPNVASGGETGLLGLALSPDWPTDPRAYVNYTVRRPDSPYEKSADGLHTVIARVDIPLAGAVDLGTVVEILSVAQPYSNHNSGSLAFGPEGALYIGVGDGGSGGDPQGHGQDTTDWLGSILRVYVGPRIDPPHRYGMPVDNPFVNKPGFRPEIWAYGVRNPWGMHFDRGGDHKLYFADVGQNAWEEVNMGVAGGNYGWNKLEGTHGYPSGEPGTAGTIPPLAQYSHEVGASVTGGVVCRDPALPSLVGTYLFADFATGVFFGYREGVFTRLASTEIHPSTFADGPNGAVYVADYAGGIYRLVTHVVR